MSVATVANRCRQHLAAPSPKRCHRCLSLKGGNVATATDPKQTARLRYFRRKRAMQLKLEEMTR